MQRLPDVIHYAVRQMCKATHRGDLNTALRWLIIAEREMDLIERLAGARRHRRVWRARDPILAAFRKAAAVANANAETEVVLPGKPLQADP